MKKGEFATWMNVGASAVSNWGKKGLLVFADDPDNPGKQLVDAEKSKLLISGTIDSTRGRPTNASRTSAEQGDQSSASAGGREPKLSASEQLRHEEARERILGRRIENERTVGGLVPRAEYERRAGDLGRLARERTHGVIRQLAERVAAETDPRLISTLLIDAVDKVYTNLADEIEADAQAELVADATLAAVEKAADEAADADDVEDG
jgi:hypothetical protein